MKRRATWTLLLTFHLALCGCDEDKSPPPSEKVAEPAPDVPVTPPPQTAPHLVIDEAGPSVRGSTALLTQANGTPDLAGRAKLRSYLEEEREFIAEKEVRIVVSRKSQPGWVSVFMSELAALNPAKVVVATETRTDFPKEVEFVPRERLSSPDPCSLVGTITDDRGTAIWRLSGGPARKRSRGMGGPDLSMTAETIESMKKSCDSKLFFVTGAEGVEWGLVYDLAASGIALSEVDLEKAVVVEGVTAGHKVVL